MLDPKDLIRAKMISGGGEIVSLNISIIRSCSNTHQLLVALSLVLASTLVATSAWGWGSIGHRAIGLIAEEELLPETVQAIKELTGGLSLEQVSMWPDGIRRKSEWRHTSGYHYLTLKDGGDYFENLTRLSERKKRRGDTLRALVAAEDRLRSWRSSPRDKYAALSFLVHFLGDLHQPLHVGRPKTAGGNRFRLDWYGESRTLHSIWDTGIILQSYIDQLPRRGNHKKAIIYAGQLQRPDRQEIEEWQSSYYEDWLKESMLDRVTAYDGGWQGLNEPYRVKGIKVVNRRILQGAYRLAHLLNQVFAGKVHKNHVTLRGRLREALGDDEKEYGIRLDPKENLEEKTRERASRRLSSMLPLDMRSDEHSECIHH